MRRGRYKQFSCHSNSGSRLRGRDHHRNEGRQVARRIKDAITVLMKEGSKPGMTVLGRAGGRNKNSFPRIALFRGCDRSLNLWIPSALRCVLLEGAVPCPDALLQSCPAVIPAGDCPLHARALVILLVGHSCPTNHNLQHPVREHSWTNVRRYPCTFISDTLLQFTKRRMRTFITIPSARNINKTDDPP